MHFSTARQMHIQTSVRARRFPCSCLFKHQTPLVNKVALSKYHRKKHEMFSFIYQRFSAFYQYSALVFECLDNLLCWVLYFRQQHVACQTNKNIVHVHDIVGAYRVFIQIIFICNFLSVAWPTGVQLLVFFWSSVPVVLFDTPEISRCQLQHVVSVESSSLLHHSIYLWFICFPWWSIDELENLHADWTTVCFEPWQKPRARLGSRKNGLSPFPVF